MRNTNKTNKPKIMIIALIAIGLIVWVGYTLEQNKSIAEAKESLGLTQMELDIAKEPSEIEILQKELENNRDERLQKQFVIDNLVEEKKALNEKADMIKQDLAERLGLQ